MKNIRLIYLFTFCTFLFTNTVNAEVFKVSSQSEFNSAQDDAAVNDSIIWESGTFSNIYMNITKSRLFIAAETLGQTVFNGNSKVKVSSDYITMQGFQFIGGDIGTSDVFSIYGSYCHFTQINIRAYRSYKYLRIREVCQYNSVTYCNFENRLNLDDQNILSILVDDTNPGYHKVQHCSFKNFEGEGNDMGIEPIRIGVSTQADFNSRSLVEYCYFTKCDGDGEIISSKAGQNVYRYNTFEDNPKAELVLRHGSEAIVYGNFFLKGKGGVRVREGQDHYIYNNYFYDIDDRPIFLQNEDSDPLDNINVAFNTVINCEPVILGGAGSFDPTNVTISNNIFADPKEFLFADRTRNETWIGNIAFGTIGLLLEGHEMTVIDPLLEENSAGFFGLSENSPAINTALPGYADLPQFEGMDPVDANVRFDLMGQERPQSIEERDMGCNEYPHNVLIRPIATEANTGPTYNTSLLPSELSDYGSGEVIITEYHNRPQKPSDEQLAAALPNNPDGADTSPNEGHTEWFEVYNTTDQPIVMDGWTLTDASSSSNVTTITSFTLAPRSYAVFSGFNIPEAQGGVEFDYFYDYKKPSFNNESSYADEGDTSCPDGVIIAKADGSLVDEVHYDYGYGEYIGNESSGSCKDNTAPIGIPAMGGSSRVSFMLNVNPEVMNSEANDFAENWSFSTITYDEEGGQKGTPGLANDGSLPPEPTEFGSGEVIITEYHNRPLKPSAEQLAAALPNNPDGADTSPNEGHTEWFEVYNTTDQAVVMDGWTLTDASSSSNVSTIGSFTLAPKSYAVFAGFNIPEAQGGVVFDYFYDYKKPSFNNESSYADEGDTSCPDGVIIAKADGSLVDEVLYDYGYGNYIGNESSGSCRDNDAPIGLPASGSSSKVTFMLKVDPFAMTAAGNDRPENWSFSTITYDEAGNQKGTPGIQNDGMGTSINDVLLEGKIRMYPNPANTVIHIVSELESPFTLQLYNILGKEMTEANFTGRSIDVSEVPVGVYLVRLNVGDKSVVKKVLIQR
ncbi:MAG: chondroitinase-B domain-containing protein [Chitinophagales bacterium]